MTERSKTTQLRRIDVALDACGLSKIELARLIGIHDTQLAPSSPALALNSYLMALVATGVNTGDVIVENDLTAMIRAIAGRWRAALREQSVTPLVEEVARALEVSASSARRYLYGERQIPPQHIRALAPMARRKTGPRPAMTNQIRVRLAAGERPADVARTLGTGAANVHAILYDMRIAERSIVPIRQFRRGELMDSVELEFPRGGSVNEIASRIGASPKSVRISIRRLRKLGRI